jgi:6-phosphogluconolactonase
MLIPIKINKFDNPEQQVIHLATQIEQTLREVIANKGEATLAVSGGKSPIALFKHLSNADLPWEKITITLVDERCVATDDNDSNEKLVRQHLLVNKAKNAAFIGLYQSKYTITEMITHLNEHSTNIDVAILGMGEDGHTASIFPECDNLEEALALNNPHDYIHTKPALAQYDRISLTMALLVKIPYLFLSVNNPNKLLILEDITLSGNHNFPLSFLLKQRPDTLIAWYK